MLNLKMVPYGEWCQIRDLEEDLALVNISHEVVLGLPWWLTQ